MRVYRQGDIVFERIEQIPESFQKSDRSTLIIEGEKANHRHVISNLVMMMVAEGQMRRDEEDQIILPVVVEVDREGGVMTHPEHPDLRVPAGTYVVRQGQEEQNLRPVDQEEDNFKKF